MCKKCKQGGRENCTKTRKDEAKRRYKKNWYKWRWKEKVDRASEKAGRKNVTVQLCLNK
jgi:hypothetical protein